MTLILIVCHLGQIIIIKKVVYLLYTGYPYHDSFRGGIFVMGLGGNNSSDDGSRRLEYHSVLYQGNNSSGEHPRYGGSSYINTTHNPADGLGTASGLYFCRCFAIDQDQSYTCSSLQ